MSNQDQIWLTSKVTQKLLRIEPCELMHIRSSGRLRFKKVGNSFMYAQEDVDAQAIRRALGEMPRVIGSNDGGDCAVHVLLVRQYETLNVGESSGRL